ncbi:MAG: rRNA maturation RNase YbeY [Cloacibacterium sp.]|jgi:rRNA maturation RNase YbeY|nr:rRNA maturation RNase YbeY [Cloacibacterium sp.]
MIHYFFENIEEILITPNTSQWLENIIISEGKKLGEINYIFCDDEYLLKVNQDFLAHDYYTDIITFDYVKGKTISGDIFVSLPRIFDNASTLSKNFEDEFHRVLAHGILHLCGYKDKTEAEEKEMRSKEDFYLLIPLSPEGEKNR